MKQQVLPVRLPCLGKQVVDELHQMENEGNKDPHESQRGPVGMVGDGAEVEHKRSDVRSHVEQWEYTVEYDEFSDGRHVEASCLQL